MTRGTDQADNLSGGGVVSGEAGDDILSGSTEADLLLGGDGNDRFIGSKGSDLIDGGSGFDFVDYYSASAAVTANLRDVSLNSGLATGDLYVSIEGLHGSRHNDSLTGNDLANEFYGHEGDDRLDGGAGNDDLLGGEGADTLDGGDGFDLASYYHAAAGVIANLSWSGANTGEAAGDTYLDIEGLGGSAY
ncbi:calcium-binding protein, partial [Microvirga splendida]|nr:protease [Microvirga splendida]